MDAFFFWGGACSLPTAVAQPDERLANRTQWMFRVDVVRQTQGAMFILEMKQEQSYELLVSDLISLKKVLRVFSAMNQLSVFLTTTMSPAK